ncbi:MAG: Hsp20/alpha crystallin family protein, partial [Sphingomonadaceae bacterium]|nr:Hsp20/alpha crystallin family protein [Sphingomonadaceae bacterium]
MALKSLAPFGSSGSPARGTDPFGNLRHDIERLFEDVTRGWQLPAAFRGDGLLNPRVDIAETDQGLELTAELPGIDEKDIDLSLDDDVLTLKAEHKAEKEKEDKKKRYHLVERSHGTYLRRFQIPFTPDAAKVSASFDKGVLKVSVPRA